MKTIAISFIVLVAVVSILVSLSAISGYLDPNIGLKDEVTATENIESHAFILSTIGNDEPDTGTQFQILPSMFWHRPPYEYIYWEPEFAEMPPIEIAEIDWDDLIKKSDPPEVIVNSDIIGVIENPNIPGIVDPSIRSGTGTIQYVDLEGGFYGIVSDDGEHYDPINLSPWFQVDDMRVSFTVKILDMASIHMWGNVVEILEIGILD